MKKIRYIILGSIVLALVVLLFTGGIHVYLGPGYRFDRDFETIEKGEGFIPSHFHVVYNYQEIPVIPILLHIFYSKLPKDINVSRYDITYLKRHDGFVRFRIDELSINYDNGRTVKIITDQHPEVDKVFQITENWQEAMVFVNVINERSSFKYRIAGVSYREDGTPYPFEREVKYTYSYGFWITTRFLKWASV